MKRIHAYKDSESAYKRKDDSFWFASLLFQFSDKPRVQPTFTNTRTFNRGEVLNMRDGSINLARTQFSSNYPSLSNPPHPYGYLHCYPRLRNFSPLAAPNITIGPTSVPRMLALPPPEQSNMFLNFPGAHREVTTQVIVRVPFSLDISIFF